MWCDMCVRNMCQTLKPNTGREMILQIKARSNVEKKNEIPQQTKVITATKIKGEHFPFSVCSNLKGDGFSCCNVWFIH